ncbi:hypothetical protein [Aeromonas hydrophila]|uniref:hypothetical protein n=1 Tax=Aeromonas hydrophila TaxID=644 RepID=UPI001F054680|nr:hypothetical protein [Aeromonas hydrophila]
MKAAMLYRYGWLLLSCLTGLAHAGAITITAEYNPANYVEDRAIFINTTPCGQAPVNWCSSGTASIDKPHAVLIPTNTYRQVKNTDDKRWGIANSTSKCNSRLKIRLLSEVRQKPPVAV